VAQPAHDAPTTAMNVNLRITAQRLPAQS